MSARVEKNRKRDPDGARRKIISTARRHFVEKGYEGARVDEITAETGFSKNLIYHYFKNKEGLFEAVLDELYSRFLSGRTDLDLAAISPVEGLRRFVIESNRAILKMPEIVSLLNSENLQKAVHVRKSKKVKTLYKLLLGELTELLSRGEQQLVFRKGLNPVQLYLSISSLMYHYLSNQYTLSIVLGENLRAASALKKREAHILDLAMRYCIRPDKLQLYLKSPRGAQSAG